MPGVRCTIDEGEANYPYDKETFGLIAAMANRIKSESVRYGVPPIAVAGSIADEYNVQRGRRRLWDWFQDQVVLTHLPSGFLKINFQHGFKWRYLNPALQDIGKGNIKITTARQMLIENPGTFTKGEDDWAELVTTF